MGELRATPKTDTALVIDSHMQQQPEQSHEEAFNDAKFEAYADAQAKAREIVVFTYAEFLAIRGGKS